MLEMSISNFNGMTSNHLEIFNVGVPPFCEEFGGLSQSRRGIRIWNLIAYTKFKTSSTIIKKFPDDYANFKEVNITLMFHCSNMFVKELSMIGRYGLWNIFLHTFIVIAMWSHSMEVVLIWRDFPKKSKNPLKVQI